MSEVAAEPILAVIPKPREIDALDDLAALLDEATYEDRLAWIRSLNGRDMRNLFQRCAGRPASVADLLRGGEGPAVCEGKNGLVTFNRFAKVFAKVGDEVVGYNRTGGLQTWFAGHGPFLAYDATAATDGAPGEIVVDYRVLPSATHPDFPPLKRNERFFGPAVVYGWMYDLIRRVSADVFIGDSFRKLPGSAPFVIVRPAR